MRTSRTTLRLAPVAAAAVALAAGCQSGRIYELTRVHADAAPVSAGVCVREGESPIQIDGEHRDHFQKALAGALAARSVEAELPGGGVPDITAEYRFVGYDPGSGPVRFGAFLVGLFGVPTGALGMGALAVSVRYFDRDGREIGQILADGPIDGPLGSTKNGLETAAESIARYTTEHFAPRAPEAVTAETPAEPGAFPGP